METFTATSGAEFQIAAASWKDAKQLKKTIEREIIKSGGLTLETALLIDSSDEVDAAIWPCLAKCLYKGQKIVEITFDDPATRGDYYDIVIACAKVNLGPLALSLLSKLKEFKLLKPQAIVSDDQKPASTMTTGSQPADLQK